MMPIMMMGESVVHWWSCPAREEGSVSASRAAMRPGDGVDPEIGIIARGTKGPKVSHGVGLRPHSWEE